MIKKRFILNLIVLLAIISCKKQSEEVKDEVPDYLPGRLTEISFESYETNELRLSYHNFEYAENEVIDKYFAFPEVYISKYRFDANYLEKVHCSLENSNELLLYIDTTTYIYTESNITEINQYTNNTSDTIVYFIENGKIIFSTNRHASSSTDGRIDHYYRWNGDNMIQFIEYIWFMREYPLETKCIFEYTGIENPFFYSNIPKLMCEYGSPQGGRYLADLVPKCSKNFPLKTTIYYNYIPNADTYTFESKVFYGANKPYQVRVVHTQYVTDYYDYFLTYEEL